MDEPFITLSSGNTTDSTASDSFDDITLLSSPPSSTTHDTSRSSFHVKDLNSFAISLQNAADRAFPNQGRTQPRYNDISVLLLRWEDDDMDVDWELQDLQKVFMNYGFGTESWLIPTKNSHLKLMSKAIKVVERHSDKEDLVILYYAGHAMINSARQATWASKSASLEWSAIQTLFEKANFDVLMLLDCCAAASAAPTVGSAVTETIAACGFESSAPQPGRHSFTNTLIEVLEDWVDTPPFSAAMLHNRVLSDLKHERPERAQNGKRRKIECRRTPIHIMGTADPKSNSIELARRLPPESKSTEDGETEQGSAPKQIGYQPETLNDSNDEDFKVPRVIISLALEEDQMLILKSCEKWLLSCPALIKFAKVEAVYKSFSTLVLLSVPVFIWNLLPEDPACSFVGYVTSTNLLKSLPECPLTSLSEELGFVVAKRPIRLLNGTSLETDHIDQSEGLNRTSMACTRCHAQKAKCDESQPNCGRCKRAGSVCEYRTTEKEIAVSAVYLKSLEQHSQNLEKALKAQGGDRETARMNPAVTDYSYELAKLRDNNDTNHETAQTYDAVDDYSLELAELRDNRDHHAWPYGQLNRLSTYSRTPELRVSHLLAERQRRTEMKELFDRLHDLMYQDSDSKANKWEILTKAIYEHQRLQHEIRELDKSITTFCDKAEASRCEINSLRSENTNLKEKLHNLNLRDLKSQAPEDMDLDGPSIGKSSCSPDLKREFSEEASFEQDLLRSKEGEPFPKAEGNPFAKYALSTSPMPHTNFSPAYEEAMTLLSTKYTQNYEQTYERLTAGNIGPLYLPMPLPFAESRYDKEERGDSPAYTQNDLHSKSHRELHHQDDVIAAIEQNFQNGGGVQMERDPCVVLVAFTTPN